MEKSRAKKTTLFLIVLFIICLLVFFLYYFVTGKENPLFNFIDKVTEPEKKLQDNYNGFYSNYEELNGSKFIFSGCSINKIANYILIIDDNYYTFRSTCMGTYPKGSGKTEDLDIQIDEEKNSYYIYYNDITYDKDTQVTNIKLNNAIAEMEKVDLSTYQLFMKETQFEGNYYNLNHLAINNSNSRINMNIIRNEENNSFNISLVSNDKGNLTLYSKNVEDFAYLPDMYTYGNNIVVVEKDNNEQNKNRYGNQFYVMRSNGIVYNLKEEFPIIIDGVTLNTNNSIYIKFDPAKRYFRMLVGYDKKMCVDNYSENEKDNIMYYEFSIEYNYSTNNFDEPKFQRIGRKSEGCQYVNNIKKG